MEKIGKYLMLSSLFILIVILIPATYFVMNMQRTEIGLPLVVFPAFISLMLFLFGALIKWTPFSDLIWDKSINNIYARVSVSIVLSFLFILVFTILIGYGFASILN